jgi:spoIIIJ-associated protein
MRLLGVEARVDVRDAEENIEVRIRDVEGGSEVEALFRACRPPLGPSLQFLINKIVNRFPEDRKHVLVEAAGAPSGPERAVSRRNADGEEEFDPELVALAQLLGDRAKALGKVITVHPMMAAERRAIHQTLMKVDGVETQSSGEGLYRQMHVVPRDGGKRRRRRGRRSSGRQGRA